MKKPFPALAVITLLSNLSCFGQSPLGQIADSITREGRKLYLSELTSWNGTDIIVEKMEDKGKIGGYFSYLDHDTSRCIFISKGESPQVIGSVSFDDPHHIAQARVDLVPRALTDEESQLFLLRSKAGEIIRSDTFYTSYQHTEFNLIPIIDGKERKVIILTGPQDNGVIILGNDYQLNFDEQNQLSGEKKLHQGVFFTDYGKAQRDGQESIGGMHSHTPQTGEFITPTDICTLMLYEKFAKWKTYYVISDGYVSIWDCQKDSLLILTKDAWDKIMKDQQKRHGK
jgi:hypothetical protein